MPFVIFKPAGKGIWLRRNASPIRWGTRDQAMTFVTATAAQAVLARLPKEHATGATVIALSSPGAP